MFVRPLQLVPTLRTGDASRMRRARVPDGDAPRDGQGLLRSVKADYLGDVQQRRLSRVDRNLLVELPLGFETLHNRAFLVDHGALAAPFKRLRDGVTI